MASVNGSSPCFAWGQRLWLSSSTRHQVCRAVGFVGQRWGGRQVQKREGTVQAHLLGRLYFLHGSPQAASPRGGQNAGWSRHGVTGGYFTQQKSEDWEKMRKWKAGREKQDGDTGEDLGYGWNRQQTRPHPCLGQYCSRQPKGRNSPHVRRQDKWTSRMRSVCAEYHSA